MENISESIRIIADSNKNNRLIICMKQLPLEVFKSVAFFSGTPPVHFYGIEVLQRVCYRQISVFRFIQHRVDANQYLLPSPGG